MNPILEKLQALHQEGLHINAVGADRINSGLWMIWIDISNMLPLGEGGDLPHHVVSVDMENMPKGVSVSGMERYPRQTLEVLASQEGIEHFMREVCVTGRAKDLVRFDGPTNDYPHFLTKPTAWL